jgi:hypothetical protein
MPVCVRTCAVRFAACEKLFLQSGHRYGRSPVDNINCNHYKSINFLGICFKTHLNESANVFSMCLDVRKFYHKVDINLAFQLRRHRCCYYLLPLHKLYSTYSTLAMKFLALPGMYLINNFFCCYYMFYVSNFSPHNYSAILLVSNNMCLIENMAYDHSPEEVRENFSQVVPTFVHLHFLVRCDCCYCYCGYLPSQGFHFVVNENQLEMNNSDMVMQVQMVVDIKHS